MPINHLKISSPSEEQISQLEKFDKALEIRGYLPDNLGTLIVPVFILSKDSTSQLPDSIGNIKPLKRLYHTDNQLTQLPNSISILENLWVLDLKNNQLTGLPDSICNPKGMSRLDIIKNQIRQLPKRISDLKDLKIIRKQGEGRRMIGKEKRSIRR